MLRSILKPRVQTDVTLLLPTMLDVTCCVRLHTLLHVLRVVGSCCAKFETSQFLATIMPNGHKNFQRCWPLPYSFRKVVWVNLRPWIRTRKVKAL